ncbi:NAD-glutamate dehydrogenase [Wolbachia endosymbiont of Dirofilaria (Dirofilaria) immitis]|uniref:NAD-glutamate dehydrogenase n=1 Tax=Wolbachia endosymbiont of Dirofilaria (Dirofilaria) immitis TaxID=1812115 RepID=UPI00158A7EF0|nr:NAD-glutamate dehydrogenase [Wolbachia endosymbiont of Dirofilaria (Dirofilaria) immitis]QKX02633.1 NAD-glutamate dehydrogenase [Wolbachia endosymbiont of Dirofilaria (Dirofilaria) immitis]
MCVNNNIDTESLFKLINQGNKKEKEKIREFVKYFYSFVYSSDLKVNNRFLLYIAEDAYNFILKKEREKSKLRVSNVNDIPGVKGNFTIVKITNDDMPFLVDSVVAAIKSHDLTIYYYSNSVINIKRKSGLIDEIYDVEENNGVKESVIYVIIKGISDSFVNTLKESLRETLKAVNYVVKDWRLMLQRLDEMKNGLCSVTQITDVKVQVSPLYTADQVIDFLIWLRNNNFIFLGYQECITDRDGKLVSSDEKNLGLMRASKEYQGSLTSSEDLNLYIIRSDLISIVHRRTYMNCIGVKEFNDQGNMVKESRFFGLFTSIAEVQDIRTIPIVKSKVKAIERKTGFVPGGHNNKALVSILQAFSCDELFQSNEDELFKICTSIMSLAIRPRVKLFLRRVGNFISCIILIPMRYASARLMFKIRDILKNETNAESSDICNNHIINEYDLMKLHVVLKNKSVSVLNDKVLCIENKLRNITEKWEDRFIDNLYGTFSTVEDIFIRYCKAFPISYQESFEPHSAYYDMKKLEMVRRKGTSEVDLKLTRDNLNYQLKVYTSSNGGLELSKILKITKNLGTKILSHNSYYIEINGGMWIHHFVLSRVDKLINNITLKEQFEMTITKVFNREIKNDYFNSLIIIAGLEWKEVLLIRALSAYLKQMSFNYDPGYIQKVVSEYPKVVKYLIQLFHVRFDPNIDIDRVETTDIFREKIEELLRGVSNVSHDYVLRSIFNLIMSILRTSYYQNDKPYLSMKFDSNKINGLPNPRPYCELYIYSNLFEGIHLRGGKLARGGLRWSDRTEDFRTEILGLMKAQMTKNAVIVPVGAKGGFVIKKVYRDENTLREKGIECYKNFIRGMLDVTDNIVDGEIIPPKNVIRYDEDDPYLVVAADKGTASFSDYANQIASEYNFWLGDAFASGGSSGYDHKRMGITARGAWIAAQRHFWKINKSIYQNVVVIGIGDMAGDLFGNGMLLSRNVRLIGAFNHMHIFIDPNPDAKSSFTERKRLFELPFSTWMDYNKGLISQGGGVFERSSKQVNVSREMKKCFGITEDVLSPNSLIRYLLKAEVDLIWNGGIGTFVKAKSESHDVVGDKANDELRVNGRDIRASMFIEGGNLGCTQLGRIEYAKSGGYINADFIDNSAGVICSDLEVNIKIAFVSVMKEGGISLKKRNEILSSMIDEVASKVLEDHNKVETKALLLECLQAKERLEQHHRLLLSLEKSGLLDRNVEFLPADEEIARMLTGAEGFNSPQLAILMSYARTAIKSEIICSELPEKDSLCRDYLLNYFPQEMATEFRDFILKHQLRREIVSTCIANDIVNRMGCIFINNLVEKTGIKVYEAVNLYIIVNHLYSLNSLWQKIDELDGKIDVSSYLQVVRSVQKFIGKVSFWLVKNLGKLSFIDLSDVAKFKDAIETLGQNLTDVLDEHLLKVYRHGSVSLIELNIDKDLAKKVADLCILAYALDVISISEQTSLSILNVGKIYFELKSLLRFDLIRTIAIKMKSHSSYWDRSLINDLLDDLSNYHYKLTVKVIKSANDCENKVQAWARDDVDYIEHYNSFLNEMVASKLDLSKLVFIIRRIKVLAS